MKFHITYYILISRWQNHLHDPSFRKIWQLHRRHIAGKMGHSMRMGPELQPTDRSFPEDYLAYLLARASYLVSQSFHKELKKHGLSVPAWRILSSLSDHERGVGELAKIVLVQQSTLSKKLDRLQEQGFVTRERGKQSRRRVTVQLTDKGRAAIVELRPLAEIKEAEMQASLPNQELEPLKDLLRNIIEHLDEQE